MTAPVIESYSTVDYTLATVNISKPTGTSEGDLLLVVVSGNTFPVPEIPSDFNVFPLRSTATPSVYICWKIAGSSEPATYDFEIAQYTAAVMLRISGADPISPLENAEVFISSSVAGTHSAPEVTSSVDSCLALRVFLQRDDPDFTATPSDSTVYFNTGIDGSADARFLVSADNTTVDASQSSGTKEVTSISTENVDSITLLIRPDQSFTEPIPTIAAFSGADAGSTISLPKPSGTAENDLLLLVVHINSQAGTLTIPSGFELIREDNYSSTNNRCAAYYKIAGNSEPDTYSVSMSGTLGLMAGMYRITGTNLENPINASAFATGAQSVLRALGVAVTPTVGNCLLVPVFFHNDNTTLDAACLDGSLGYFENTAGTDGAVLFAKSVLSAPANTESHPVHAFWYGDYSRVDAAYVIAIAPAETGINGEASLAVTSSVESVGFRSRSSSSELLSEADLDLLPTRIRKGSSELEASAAVEADGTLDVVFFVFGEAEIESIAAVLEASSFRSRAASVEVSGSAAIDSLAAMQASGLAVLVASASVSATATVEEELFGVFQTFQSVETGYATSSLLTNQTNIRVGRNTASPYTGLFSYIRFTGIEVPEAANITEATLRLQTSTTSVATPVVFQVRANDTKFSYLPTSRDDLIAKPRTDATHVRTLTSVSSGAILSFDLQSVFQELVDREDWDDISGGHAVTIFLDDVPQNAATWLFHTGVSVGPIRPELSLQYGTDGLQIATANLSGKATLAAVGVETQVLLSSSATLSARAAVKQVVPFHATAASSISAGSRVVLSSSASISGGAVTVTNGVRNFYQHAATLTSGSSLQVDGNRQMFVNLKVDNASEPWGGAYVDVEGILSRTLPPDESSVPFTMARRFSMGSQNPQRPVPNVTWSTSIYPTESPQFHDQEVFRMTVNSSPVQLGGLGRYGVFVEGDQFQLDELTKSYTGGKSLKFTEFPDATFSPASESYALGSFSHNDLVKLEKNFSDVGFGTLFLGKIRTIDREGRNVGESISYGVIGMDQVANDVQVEFTVSTTIATGSFSVPNLRLAVAQLFQKYGTDLSDLYGNLGEFDLFGLPHQEITRELQLNGGFFDSLKQLTSAFGEAVPYYHDRLERWVFVTPHRSISLVTDVTDAFSHEVLEHSSNETTEDRYTAILLQEPLETVEQLELFGGKLEKNWGPIEESSWTAEKAAETGSPYSKVYREFVYNGAAPVPADNRGFVGINRSVVQGWEVIMPSLTYSYRLKEGHPQYESAPNTLFSATVGPITIPILGRQQTTVQANVRYEGIRVIFEINGNEGSQGDENNPGDARVGYLTSQYFGAYYTRKVQENRKEIRYPLGGYVGTAYSAAGIERVLTVQVGKGEATIELAKRLLSVHQDINVSGTLPMHRDISGIMSDLNFQVQLIHDSRTPVFSQFSVPVHGFTLTFGNVPVISLDVSNRRNF